MTDLGEQTVLVIGVGGLGCPAALALARAGVGHLKLVDDDVVSEDNLHRQILFEDADIGRHKLDAAEAALLARGARAVSTHRGRFTPESALELGASAQVIVEGADNFATKFLAADAARVLNVPIVHGAGVRWHGTALLTASSGRPCYRCLFEELLADDEAPNCSTAGVMGPVVGVLGALMADLALDALGDDETRAGVIHSVDARARTYRSAQIFPRKGCLTCGLEPVLASQITRARYAAAPSSAT